MSNCHCGREVDFKECCAPLIEGAKKAQTAEELMRSRYSAYVTGAIDYIVQTHGGRSEDENERENLEAWSRESEWMGLEVLSTDQGGAEDKTGEVEFKAHYKVDGQEHTHHEKAEFKKQDGTWFFVDGKIVPAQIKRGQPKVGRNEPCPCGSGKKFKKCCA